MPKVKLKVGHSAGRRKIYDRKPKMDPNNQPIEGKFVEHIHAIGVDQFTVSKEPIMDEKTNEQVKDAYNRPKFKKLYDCKPFEVYDLEYVMKRHGAILEEVK